MGKIENRLPKKWVEDECSSTCYNHVWNTLWYQVPSTFNFFYFIIDKNLNINVLNNKSDHCNETLASKYLQTASHLYH